MYSIEDFRTDGSKPASIALIKGEWVVARPLNYKTRTLKEKIKEAWAVFTGKAEAITFKGQ